MVKARFKMKYRNKIESGEYKLVTADDRQCRVVCWDAHNYGREDDIIVMVTSTLGGETIQRYGQDGLLISNRGSGHNDKWALYVIGDIDPDFTIFDKKVKQSLENNFPDIDFSNDFRVQDFAEDVFNIAIEEIRLRGNVIVALPDNHFEIPKIKEVFGPEAESSDEVAIRDLSKLLLEYGSTNISANDFVRENLGAFYKAVDKSF